MTAEEFAEIDLDVPVELVRGAVIKLPYPGMRHGVVCGNICYMLTAWTRAGGDRIVACGSGVITTRNPDSVRGPDVLSVALARLPDQRVPAGFLEVAPDLAAEVLSHSDDWEVLLEKISEYFDAGVREVWVANPEVKSVLVYRPNATPRIFGFSDVITSADVLPGFSC